MGGLFGKNGLKGVLFGSAAASKTRPGTPEQSMAGYEAMPSWMKNLWNQYGKDLYDLRQNLYPLDRMRMIQEPKDMFNSQELYELQKTNPGKPVQPIGVLEPFNQAQKQALSMYANPDYTDQGLAQFLQPFQSRSDAVKNDVMNNINRNANIGLSNIRDRGSRIGTLARGSGYANLMPQIEEARARALAETENKFNQNNLLQALGLREDSLASMLNAGNLVQKQNQAGLDLSQPEQLIQRNPMYGQLSALLPLLQGLPGSNVSKGATAPKPNVWSRITGAGLSLFGGGNQFGGMF